MLLTVAWAFYWSNWFFSCSPHLCNSLLVFSSLGAVYLITPCPQIYITLVQWSSFLLARAVYMSRMVANRTTKYNLSPGNKYFWKIIMSPFSNLWLPIKFIPCLKFICLNVLIKNMCYCLRYIFYVNIILLW